MAVAISKATEAGFREAFGAAERWRAVHLACHGLVRSDRPMLSSLALTRSGDDDGFLTALKILRMEIPADLAVLAACETARGRVVATAFGAVGLAIWSLVLVFTSDLGSTPKTLLALLIVGFVTLVLMAARARARTAPYDPYTEVRR